MIKVITDHPIAYDSPDHIQPWGTARDNSTNEEFIKQTEQWFNNEPFKTLDIGCSGGQLTVDYANRGHLAVGIEGSDYSIDFLLSHFSNVLRYFFTLFFIISL